jgi:hypothetical protein
MDGPETEPSQELHGREALTPVFEDLNRYREYGRLQGFRSGSAVGHDQQYARIRADMQRLGNLDGGGRIWPRAQ